MAPILPAPDPIDPSFIPKTSIKTLPAATTSVEEILATLDTDGGIILTDFVNTTELEAIAEETAPYYENKGPPGHDIVLIPKETILLGGLVGKSKTAAKICEHRTLKELRDRILVERYDYKQEGLPVRKITIQPLLSVSLTFNVAYGAPRQRLHRDDNIWGTKHRAPIKLEEETQFGVLIAGVDVKRENGATMFVPGSHRWDDERLPSVDEICFAEMKPGSALIFLSSAYHGGGHNSVPGFTRTVHGFFFCRGNRRTEENQFLAIPQSTALAMSDEMLSLLGYKKPDTTLGLVESQDALAYVRSTLVKADA